VKVTERRTAIHYANVLKDLSDIHFPSAKTIVLVQDNLNTHAPASLYEAFPAPEARRLVERFEWHYTPKHGSWLDLAESELGVLATQCLDRRIPDRETLVEEVAAWQRDRNRNHAKADWHFTTEMPVSNSSTSTLHSSVICSKAHEPPKCYRAWALLPWRHMPRTPPTPADSALIRLGMRLSNRPSSKRQKHLCYVPLPFWALSKEFDETTAADPAQGRHRAGVRYANPAVRLSIVPTSPATVSRLQRSSTCGLRATISQPPHCGG
jgi:hypothetical protein